MEQLYEAHKQATLPLVMLKYEHDCHLQELLPSGSLEELGGYKALLEDEINGVHHYSINHSGGYPRCKSTLLPLLIMLMLQDNAG